MTNPIRWYTRQLRKDIRSLRTGVKAFGLRISTTTAFGWSVMFGRSRYDYSRYVGDGSGNSIVMACVQWIARTFPEAPLRVVRTRNDGSRNYILDHPLAELVDNPNPFYSGIVLWMGTLVDWTTGGNAYWLKRRSKAGNVIELWYIPSFMVEPVREEKSTNFLDYYVYDPGDGQTVRLDIEDIVHFRYGIDPHNIMKGLSPLASVLRMIFTDDEAANFSAALLRNMGIPGVMISPEDDTTELTQPEADAIKEEYIQRFNGDERGKPMVLSGKVKVQILSFSPQQLNLTAMHRLPEERITAVLGIPAVVVGMGAGLASAAYNNMAEARAAAYESNILPSQMMFAAEVERQLLKDFPTPGRGRVDVEFDLSNVRVLQPEQNALYRRVSLAVQTGWFTVGQALREVGKPTRPEDDYYLRPAAIGAIRLADADKPTPKPVVARPSTPNTGNQPTRPNPQPAGGTAPSGRDAVIAASYDPWYRRWSSDEEEFEALPSAEVKDLKLSGDRPDVPPEDRAFWHLIRQIKGLVQPMFESDLRDYYIALRSRIETRMSKREDLAGLTAHDLAPITTERPYLRTIFRRNYLRLAVILTDILNTQLDEDRPYTHDDPLIQAMLGTVGSRIGEIHAETLEALSELLDLGRSRSYSPDAFLRGVILDDFGGVHGLVTTWCLDRVSRIATGELSMWTGQTQVERYRGQDRVMAIRLLDSHEDPDCAALDGRVVSLDEFDEHVDRGCPTGTLTGVPILSAAPLARTNGSARDALMVAR